MKTLISRIAVLFVISSYACGADKFVIHKQEITIQAPKGYVLVTDEMPEVKKIVGQLADHLNDTIAYYIPETEVPAAMGSGTLDLSRTFIIKADKRLRKEGVSDYIFPYHKDLLKKQLKKTTQDLKSKLPRHLDTINDRINEGSDLKVALSISQLVPLDIHHEDKNSLAYSMFINYGLSSGEYKESEIAAATCTVLHVKDSMIVLLCYAPKDELEITRRSSLIWNQQIVTDNKVEDPIITPLTENVEPKDKHNYLVSVAITMILLIMAFTFFAKIFTRKR
jgi:hypothetical protein